jgi:hypothetical protein
MLDKNYFRYKLKTKQIKIDEIAKKCGCRPQNINYKILNERLNINEIFIILEMTGLTFEEIFKKENGKNE